MLNREILFKGKNDTYGWMYGLVIYDLDKRLQKTNYQIYSHLNSSTYPVDPKTICQFTGRFDSHGLSIFEGDILQHKRSGIEFVVKYKEHLNGFDLHNDSVNSKYVVRSWEELTIVGNIHD